MNELVIIKKKKRRLRSSERLIGMQESSITEESALDIITNIEKKVIKILRLHIGQENSISPYDLFVRIYGKNPGELEVYRRTYYWNIIRKVLSRLRGTNELFSVIKGGKVFVLKSRDELTFVKNRIENTITAYKHLKSNANTWVREEKWKTLLNEGGKE